MDRILHQGKIVELVEFDVEQAGKKFTFEKARRSPGVRLILEHDGKILLTREDRHEAGGYDFRLPGGKVFDTLTEYNEALTKEVSMQEAAQHAAAKEAREEAGVEVDATALTFFHKSICGTTMEWDLYYFVATQFTETHRELEEGEDISIGWFDKETVKKMCLDRSINEERSALVLLRYLASKE